MNIHLSDAEYEAKLDEFNAHANAVKSPPTPKLFIGAATWKPDRMPDPDNRDKDGVNLDILALERQYQRGVVKPKIDYTKIGRSFIRNSYNQRSMLFLSLASSDTTWGDGHINRKTLAGTVNNLSMWCPQQSNGYINTTYGDDTTEGIHIGTDNTAVSRDDYNLIAKISHGDGVGEMRHWDMFVITPAYDSGTRVWTVEIVRYFTNHSGGSITVREMLLVDYAYASTGGWYSAMARDLLSPAIAVDDLELIRTKYLMTFDAFPA